MSCEANSSQNSLLVSHKWIMPCKSNSSLYILYITALYHVDSTVFITEMYKLQTTLYKRTCTDLTMLTMKCRLSISNLGTHFRSRRYNWRSEYRPTLRTQYIKFLSLWYIISCVGYFFVGVADCIYGYGGHFSGQSGHNGAHLITWALNGALNPCDHGGHDQLTVATWMKYSGQ